LLVQKKSLKILLRG